MSLTYQEKLKTRPWQKKRLELLQAVNWKCEDCSSELDGTTQLHIHHCAYIPGVEPWDHPNSLLMCLCSHCHNRRQTAENELRIVIGGMTRKMRLLELDEYFWDFIAESSKRELARELLKHYVR